MIFFNKNDIHSIDRKTIQDAVEKAYKLMLADQYNMPDRIHVTDNQNVLLLMPCFSTEYFVTKLVSVFPDAQAQGMPSVNGLVVLNDNKTGEPLAVMDGASLTAQRTGAVGGLAVKLLTSPAIESAGVFGAGVQGIQQARYLLINRDIKNLNLYDLNPESARKMGSQLAAEFDGVLCNVSASPEQLVKDSELVVAATTSRLPLFDLLPGQLKGKTFISIGSFQPDMQEFPNAVIETADTVYVDTLFACKESGDIAIPLAQNHTAGEKIREFAGLLHKSKFSRPETATVFFKSVGMALFDLVVAIAIYNLSEAHRIGRKLDF